MTPQTLHPWQACAQGTVGVVSLDIALGGDASQPLALIGPNGSGKTTFLRFLAGQWLPPRGRFTVGTSKLFDGDQGINVPTERRCLGYLPQGDSLFPHLTVLDNVAFGLSVGPGKMGRTERRDRALAALRSLDVAALAGRHPVRLSGGERQRVALARALAPRPQMLLLDEPMGALDASSRRQVRSLLSDYLEASQIPTLIVTHDVRDVRALGATVAVLERGRVVQRGSLEELARDELANTKASDFVAEFL